jgi:hypothetical protein
LPDPLLGNLNGSKCQDIPTIGDYTRRLGAEIKSGTGMLVGRSSTAFEGIYSFCVTCVPSRRRFCHCARQTSLINRADRDKIFEKY